MRKASLFSIQSLLLLLLLLSLNLVVSGQQVIADKPASTRYLNKVIPTDFESSTDGSDRLLIAGNLPCKNASFMANNFPEQRLATDLLAQYTPWARACRNCTEPVEVSLEFSLMQINSLDEKSQVLTTTGWLTVRWKDDKLVWRPGDYANLTTLEIPASLVWVPIFGLDNHARSLYDSTFRSEFFVRVDYDGQVHWDVGNQFVSSCRLSLFYYPWDRQACVLSFQSYSHTARKMRLFADKPSINLEDFTPNGEWNISNTTACHTLSLYSVSSPDGFWSVHFEIQLNRKPKFYITHMITPCVVLAVLVFIVFWLPPEAGEKVSLAMTILLSFSVFLLMIAENMPKTSDSVPLVAIYLASFMAASAISVILSVWIIRSFYHDLNCKSRRTGKWSRAFIRRFAFLVDVDSKTVEAILSANKGTRSEPIINNSSSTEVDKTNNATTNDDDLTSQVRQAAGGDGSASPLLTKAEAFIIAHEKVDNNNADNNCDNNNNKSYYLKSLAVMANDVKQLSRSVSSMRRVFENTVKRRAVDESCTSEWRLLALVADRVILFVHVITFIGSFIYVGFIFAEAPAYATTGACDDLPPTPPPTSLRQQ